MDHPAADQIADLVGGEFGSSKNREHARHLGRGAGVNRFDGRVGMRRAKKIGVSLPRPIDIVGIVAGAGDEAAVFFSAYRGADTGRAHGLRPPRSPLFSFPIRPTYSAALAAAPPPRMARAPAAIALTMLW